MKMSCESAYLSSELALDSNVIAKEFRKDSRISYTRDSLLSLAEVNVSKELPTGFDRSILSELDDACKSAPEHQKLVGHEFTGKTWGDSNRESAERWGGSKLSPKDRLTDVCKSAPEHERLPGHEFTGGQLGDAGQESAERWDSCKLSSKDRLNDACKSAREHQKLPSPEFAGRLSDDSSGESAARWGSCKFSSKDSKTIDSGNSHSNQAQRSWQKPENTGILGSLQKPERSSILGSWSASKQPLAGSEGSTLNLQGADGCLLSRCNEPYRPPSFYKAMNHSGSQNHDSFSNRPGFAECPSKERAMGGSWRKDTCLVLEEHSITPPLTSKENPSPTAPAVSGSVERPCSAGAEKCLTEESPVHSLPLQNTVVQQLPSKSQMMKINSGAVILDVEKFHGPILDGGRFSALINLEETEDIDAHFLDEENLASSDSSSSGRNVNDANMEFENLEKKELRSHAGYSAKSKVTKIDDIQFNTNGKTGSVASASAVRPSVGASNSQLACVAQDWKGIDAAAKELHNVSDPLTLGPDQSEVRAKISDAPMSEIWQSSRCTKYHGDIVDGSILDGISCRSGSRFIHWFPDNEKSDNDILTEADEEGWIVWGASFDKSMKEKILGQGNPKKASTYGQKAPFGKITKSGVSGCLDSRCAVKNNFYPEEISNLTKTAENQELQHATGEISGLQIVKEANSSLELNLPDENDLITIDDTYILEQDEPKPSPEIASSSGRCISHFPGSNELIGSESVQQILSLPNPWNYESQMNSRNLIVNPSESTPHINAPPRFYDPWKTRHNDYNPFDVFPPLSGWQPLKPNNHEPSLENFLSPRTAQADDYCPDLDRILSADPSTYHQLLQTPCCSPEPNVLRSLPLNYQNNVNSIMDVGKRGPLAEERNMSKIQYLQLHRKLEQMNIDAAEQRAYSKAASKLIW